MGEMGTYKRVNTHMANGSSEWHKRLYRKNRLAIDALKNVPCVDCHHLFPACCMDFDHRDPTSKKFTVAQYMCHPLVKILKEVEKCDIVCSNCHRIRTSLRKKLRISG